MIARGKAENATANVTCQPDDETNINEQMSSRAQCHPERSEGPAFRFSLFAFRFSLFAFRFSLFAFR
jgi:hypothetical protein